MSFWICVIDKFVIFMLSTSLTENGSQHSLFILFNAVGSVVMYTLSFLIFIKFIFSLFLDQSYLKFINYSNLFRELTLDSSSFLNCCLFSLSLIFSHLYSLFYYGFILFFCIPQIWCVSGSFSSKYFLSYFIISSLTHWLFRTITFISKYLIYSRFLIGLSFKFIMIRE